MWGCIAGFAECRSLAAAALVKVCAAAARGVLQGRWARWQLLLSCARFHVAGHRSAAVAFVEAGAAAVLVFARCRIIAAASLVEVRMAVAPVFPNVSAARNLLS